MTATRMMRSTDIEMRMIEYGIEVVTNTDPGMMIGTGFGMIDQMMRDTDPEVMTDISQEMMIDTEMMISTDHGMTTGIEYEMMIDIDITDLGMMPSIALVTMINIEQEMMIDTGVILKIK